MEEIKVRSLIARFQSLLEQSIAVEEQLNQDGIFDMAKSELKIDGILAEQYELVGELNSILESHLYLAVVSPLPRTKNSDKKISYLVRLIGKCRGIIPMLEDILSNSRKYSDFFDSLVELKFTAEELWENLNSYSLERFGRLLGTTKRHLETLNLPLIDEQYGILYYILSIASEFYRNKENLMRLRRKNFDQESIDLIEKNKILLDQIVKSYAVIRSRSKNIASDSNA